MKHLSFLKGNSKPMDIFVVDRAGRYLDANDLPRSGKEPYTAIRIF